MNRIAFILTIFLGLVSNSNASEEFLVNAQIIQNNQIIGAPKLLLAEAEEGTIEIMAGKEHTLYSLAATVVSEKEDHVLVKTALKLSNKNALVAAGEPQFILKKGETGTIEFDHPLHGTVELTINVNMKNYN